MKTTFQDILNQKCWNNYEQYISEGIEEYTKDLEKSITKGKEYRKQIRTYLEDHFSITKIPDSLDEEFKLLKTGNVIGIDGTIATHKTISGIISQIGIIAVNYLNDKIQQSHFISEANCTDDMNSVTDYLFSHEKTERIISSPVLYAALQVKERLLGLEDKFVDKYKMYHGPLVPFEMIASPGKHSLKVLEVTLSVLKKITQNKKCFSIISRSQNDAYMRIGLSLNPGEYIKMVGSVGTEIMDDRNFISRREKWRGSDFKQVKDFLQDDAKKICIGIIKVYKRPYIFHAHQDAFNLAARIIARDSQFQHEKGFPLLIDYADTLCSNYFKASDFNKIVEYKLALEGEYFSETSEEELRQR